MASVSLSVALSGTASPSELTQPLTHETSENLVLEIQQLLEKHGQSWDALTAISVTNGPGGYTSLRIGIATAKTIAYARGIPLYPVSTLSAIAHQHAKGNGLLATVLPARSDQLNVALWSVLAGIPRRLTSDFVAQTHALRNRFSQIGPALCVAGPDLSTCRVDSGLTIVEKPLSGLAVIAAAKSALASKTAPGLETVNPRYTYGVSIGGVPGGFDKKSKGA